MRITAALFKQLIGVLTPLSKTYLNIHSVKIKQVITEHKRHDEYILHFHLRKICP